MREIQAGVTKGRVLGATAFLVIATAIMIALGVEVGSYLAGVVAGFAVVLAVVLLRKRKRPTTPGQAP